MKKLSVMIIAFTFILSACTSGGIIVTEPVHYPDTEPVYYPDDAQINIPPGHMPPPGKCRIWYPNRPAGHQPPPGECPDLEHRVPPGAVLIYGK